MLLQVVIDDYLPVRNDKDLIFNQSKEEGEVWPCLLEKAYAKLQGDKNQTKLVFNLLHSFLGSYIHLNGGFSASAMVDFSGGFPEVEF